MNDNWNINKENDPDFLSEKREFSLLYSIEKKSPFAVPPGYFEENQLNISLRIDVLKQHSDINPQNEAGLPRNYFEELENKIKSAVELDALKTQAFETPADYFENFESDLRLKLMLDGLKEQSFSVPDEYFRENEGSLKTTVWLAQFKNESVFETPANYFETLESRLRARMEEEQGAKIVQLSTTHIKLKYFAAAAAFVGICFMAYFFLRNDIKIADTPVRQLSALDKKQIIANPGEFGIDENAVVELLNENPELLASADVVPEDVSAELMNEIVMDKDVDISSMVGEN